MIRRALALLPFILVLTSSAAAQERVTVGTQRLVTNSVLFLAVAKGYFKEEGLVVEMTAYRSDREVADAVASGATDFGLTAFSPAAFTYASRGFIKAVAAQAREKRGFDGYQIVASKVAYAKGLRNFDDLAGKSVAITELGSAAHYQIGQIARIRKFDFKGLILKPMHTLDNMARAIATNRVDAAIMPEQFARELMTADLARLVGSYSAIAEQELGALFVSVKVIEKRRAVVEKFVRAYRRGAATYSGMVLVDRYGKRVENSRTREIATVIAPYVYPGVSLGVAAATIVHGAFSMDPGAQLDPADIERQVGWFKAQGLIDTSVDGRAVSDPSFVAVR